MKIKKAQDGFLTGRNKPKKEKTKETSKDKMYVTKTVKKTYDGPNVQGTKTKTKTRRTVEGVLLGKKPGTNIRTKDITKTNKRTAIAPGPNFKRGGKIKRNGNNKKG